MWVAVPTLGPSSTVFPGRAHVVECSVEELVPKLSLHGMLALEAPQHHSFKIPFFINPYMLCAVC